MHEIFITIYYYVSFGGMKMKKFVTCALLAGLVVFSSTTVFAVKSPVATPVPGPGTDKSPETGDINMLGVEIAGLACAATALVATKRRKDA